VPPNLPMAVRQALTMTTSRSVDMFTFSLTPSQPIEPMGFTPILSVPSVFIGSIGFIG